MSFKCDCCGLCCRSLKKVPALRNFDRGDGVCINLGDDNLCRIYNDRPEICNVELMYERVFSNYCSKEDFFRMNEKQCKKIKEEFSV
jgi:Fe-S-cluster containining protein